MAINSSLERDYNAMSNELQEFAPKEVNQNGVVWYDARDIHEYVQNKREFATYIKQRIAEIGAVEGVDYLIDRFVKQVNGQGRQVIDYYVTPEMGQELGMLERNAKGREIRQWFIARNKKLESIESRLSPIQMLLRQAQAMADLEQQQNATHALTLRNNQELARLDRKIDDYYEADCDDGYRTLSAYAKRIHLKPVPSDRDLQACGKIASAIWEGLYGSKPKKSGHKKYDTVNAYPVAFLDEYYQTIFRPVLRQ